MAGPTAHPRRNLMAGPGPRPVFRKTLTCYRPFTRLKADFRDWPPKAPATARSYDLPEARVKKRSGTPEDSFRLFSHSDQPLKDLPVRSAVKYTRKHCFVAYAWLWMNLPPNKGGSALLTRFPWGWLSTPCDPSSGLLSLTRSYQK